MSYTLFNTCCYLKTGKCDNLRCLYVHNKYCEYNLLCNNKNCNLYHDCSYKKRLIVIEIYNNNLNNIKEDEEKCYNFINCSDKNCSKNHVIEKKHRLNICNIISNNNTDIEALEIYNNLYNNLKFITIKNNIITNILEYNNIINNYSNEIINLSKIIQEKIELLKEKKKFIKNNKNEKLRMIKKFQKII